MLNEFCEKIISRRQSISVPELISLFDSIIENLTTENVGDYHCVIDALSRIRLVTILDNNLINHNLLHIIHNLLTKILDRWYRNPIPLNDVDGSLFHEIVDFYSKLIKHIKNTDQETSLTGFQNLFLNLTFFETLNTLLRDLADNPEKYKDQIEPLNYLNSLLRSIQWYQAGIDGIRDHSNVLILVDSITFCLSSKSYRETFEELNIENNFLTAYEQFLLVRCPCYIVWNRGKAQLMCIERLCSNGLLPIYQTIFERFLATVEIWESAVTESIYFMTAILRYVALHATTRNFFLDTPKLIDSVLILLNSKRLIENVLITTDYNSETNITDSAISVIFNLTNDCKFLSILRSNPEFLIDTFSQLKQSKVDRVQLHAFMVLAKFMNEEDVLKLEQMDVLVGTFMNYLLRACDDSRHNFQDVPIKHILISFKAFIQHDQIKDEIFKQNHIGLFVRCATETYPESESILQLSLEIIWILIFNAKLMNVLRSTYGEFIKHIQDVLVNSSHSGVQSAAKGILWKLEAHSVDTKSNLILQNERDPTEKHDIMISYSHANKDLCHKIYKHLTEMNYRVWLDFENMFGSTLESMAHAIESSDIILIGMSNPYKQSAYCRSEAEYAYAKQRHIIPMIFESKYRPDGWLGFICASKMYVDFTKSEYEAAFQKLVSQIELYRQKRSANQSSTEKETKTKRSSTLLLTHGGSFKDETSQPKGIDNDKTYSEENSIKVQPILEKQSRNFRTMYTERYIECWTHADVLDFIDDHNLSFIKPLFVDEQQFNGQCLYKLYREARRNHHLTYTLLRDQLYQLNNEHLLYSSYVRLINQTEQYSMSMSFGYYFRYVYWLLKRFIRRCVRWSFPLFF